MATTHPTAHYVDVVEQDRAEVEVALLTTRLVAGLVMLPHGAQHLLGAFNGPGLAGTVQFLGTVGYLVAIGEFFGGIGLIAGVLSRFSAAAIIGIMIGAALMVHVPFGFFMNWSGTQKGEGFEYHVLMVGLLLPTLIAGPGRFSLSRFFHAPKFVE
jgi:putative oxidoreductase